MSAPQAAPPRDASALLSPQTIATIILATIAVATVLYWLRAVMIPFVLAVFIAISVRPFIQLLTERLRLPRILAVLVVLVVVGFALNVLAGLVIASLQELAANAAVYQSQFRIMVERLSEQIPYELLGLEKETGVQPLSLIPRGTVGGFIVGITNNLLDFASRGVLVMIFVFFMSIGEPAPPSRGSGIRMELERQVRRYLFTKTILSAATGAAVAGILMTIGVDLAVVFGLLAFFLNFVPSIGSIIATLLPLPVVLVSPTIGPTEAALAIALPGAVQVLIGNFIDPKVMGDSLDLHPVTILLSLMVWGAIWGIVGMLLATPITAVVKLLLERTQAGRPLAALLSGRVDAMWSEP